MMPRFRWARPIPDRVLRLGGQQGVEHLAADLQLGREQHPGGFVGDVLATAEPVEGLGVDPDLAREQVLRDGATPGVHEGLQGVEGLGHGAESGPNARRKQQPALDSAGQMPDSHAGQEAPGCRQVLADNGNREPAEPPEQENDVTTNTPLFAPGQLDAEMASRRAAVTRTAYTIERPDGTWVPGTWADHLTTFAAAAKESARLGRPVVCRGPGLYSPEVVDMALAATRARATLDELRESDHRDAPEIATKLAAAIAADSWVDMVDETTEARIALGYVCSARGCMNEIDGPEPGAYCSHDCARRDQ